MHEWVGLGHLFRPVQGFLGSKVLVADICGICAIRGQHPVRFVRLRAFMANHPYSSAFICGSARIRGFAADLTGALGGL
jgi:hypothetical protein